MSAIVRRWKLRLAAPLLLLAPLLASASPSAADPRAPWPSRVQALYRVDFNGFDIGTFEFHASVTGQSYTLKADAKLSALLGAFKWRGITHSAGVLAAEVPRPAAYTFDFEGTAKNGSLKMAFRGDSVTSLAHSPPYTPSPSAVPVREAQLKGVLDPLSAVMALSRSGDENPCDRKLSIFDGKQRFDLALSFRRQEAVAEARPSGQPGVAFVCNVRYLPIAGHRMNDETRAMANSRDIEVSLRPVPSANLFIPHQIRIPTGAGPATLTSIRVDIMTPRNEQIALSY
jgi:hypothetical protein